MSSSKSEMVSTIILGAASLARGAGSNSGVLSVVARGRANPAVEAGDRRQGRLHIAVFNSCLHS